MLAGRDSHGLTGGFDWFVTVLWPFALSWFAIALATSLYRRPANQWWRLALTWVGGVSLALVLRDAATDREVLPTFAIVAFAFVGLFTFGWRAVAWAVTRAVTRR